MAAVLVAVVPGASWAIDPDLPFSSGSTGADGRLKFKDIPPVRAGVAGAYDGVSQRFIIFGGEAGGTYFNDTWKWEEATKEWVQVPTAVSPRARAGHRMVYDPMRRQVVLFGGIGLGGLRFNDTWVWDGRNWTEKTPANKPPAQHSPQMVYVGGEQDFGAQQRVLMFHGHDGEGDAFWLWDGTNWERRTMGTTRPAHHPDSPVAFMLGAGPADDRVVLFNVFSETWLLNPMDLVWTRATPETTTPTRQFGGARMVYVPGEGALMLGGNDTGETWAWTGKDWRRRTDRDPVMGRYGFAMDLWMDGQIPVVMMFGGTMAGNRQPLADTFYWSRSVNPSAPRWMFQTGSIQTFDLSARASGIWNFTTIEVPVGVTVNFKRNAANTPVRWLASGDVTIRGGIDVSGEPGLNSFPAGVVAQGGPGGFAGGRGGVNSNISGNRTGFAGQGPGGGAPGTAENVHGQRGNYSNTQVPGSYGNSFIQPLVGGSGGGGGASSAGSDGSNAGGGGGAILISSSRDIQLEGAVVANGGYWENRGNGAAGAGSGGAILLRADRVTGAGRLEAVSGDGQWNGRIRVESYIRTLSGTRTPTEVAGQPMGNGEMNLAATLQIVDVAGAAVAGVPGANLTVPDVVFSAAGSVQIRVRGSEPATGNPIPNGTQVSLRIVTDTGVITPAPVGSVGGIATFNVTVPKGVGTIQASAVLVSP